ncbi:MAG: YraN family protein [Candidatus Aminicenantales bacterium]
MGENTPSDRRLGISGEEAAARYLEKKRYRIISRSYRMLRGEIDIIAYDRKTLVFVEVKTRKSKSFGPPEESVTTAKQRQIKKIALGYLSRNRLQNMPCRFDVLSVLFSEEEGFIIRHIQNAF